MNFSVNRTPLLTAVQKVHAIVEKKNTIPILGNLLFSVEAQKLFLYATDLEIGIKVNLPVESSQSGMSTLPSKEFLEILKELPNEKLHFRKKENHWVELSCGLSKFNLAGLSADQYPSLPGFEKKTYSEAKCLILAEMIDRTQFAICTDPSRYMINSIFLEILKDGQCRIVATDGHRLSYVDQEVFLNTPPFEGGIILPRKGVHELRNLLSPTLEKVNLAFELGYLYAYIDQTYLSIRLVEGKYPNYKAVIPKSLDKLARINRQNFLSALKRVSLFSHEKNKGLKLSLKKNFLRLTSSSPEIGEAQEDMEINYEQEPIEIKFNSKYLLDCLQVMKSNDIEFHLKDSQSSALLIESDSKNHSYILMPIYSNYEN